ncbi:MAG: tetratricopeptide repeat protein [Calothrix sp. C42_A2020_038]|nr:tetratricopeptide repeat protein [Calothrix sp. C42_A2020_038]
MSQLLGVRYQIIRVLSANEIGESYLVTDIESANQLYYIFQKYFLRSQHEQEINRAINLFQNEAQTLQNIAQKHERIQKIFAYWQEEQELCLLKEFVQGYSLGQEIEAKIKQSQYFTEEEVVSFLLSVLKLLVYVHSQGVIHLNIKPNNIIRRSSDDSLVLVDFGGISEAINNYIDISEYTPMEQFHGNPQFNSDIYALGVIAISALTGLPPREITGINSPRNFLTGEICWRHRSQKVSGRLAGVINKMVKLDYRYRYQSALDALIEIRPLQDKYFSIRQERKARINLILLAAFVSFVVTGIIAWILVKPKDINQAQLFYQKGVDKYEQENYKAAITNFNKAIDINPDYAQAYNRRGDAYYRLGEYQKSQADSSMAIRLNPEDANSYYDRGFSLYSLGNYNGAIADYNQAIKLEPKNANAYYARGLARNKINEKQAAFEDFSQAIALNPEFALAYIERGKLLRRQDKKLNAAKDFNAAVTLQAENAELYYERGLNYRQLNQKQLAKKDFTKAIELNSKYIKAYLARGDVYSDLGNPEKAYADYNQALLLNDKLSDTYIHLGNYRLKNNDIAGAITDFNKAIALEPNNALAYNYRGTANIERGFSKESIKDYTKALELNPNYGDAYYNRGLAYTYLGKISQAISDFEKAAQSFLDQDEQNNYNDAKSKLKALRARS